MARIPAQLRLSPDELDELMTTSWNMRVATVGPVERINLTPLWFGWAGGRVYFYCRGQKIANLRRNPSCTVLVVEEVRWQLGTKYEGGHGEPPSPEPVRYPLTAAGRSARWVVFQPDRLITWHNHKLPRH